MNYMLKKHIISMKVANAIKLLGHDNKEAIMVAKRLIGRESQVRIKK